MQIIFNGDSKKYNTAVVQAFVYECSGHYEPEPVFVCECYYTNQFSKEELISDISMRAGMQSVIIGGFDPDIRKIQITYRED